MLDLWLVRHAESLGNKSGSQADTDLSPDGEAQARALADELSAASFDHVYSSPLVRARRTAELALPSANIIVDVRLRELVVASETFLDVTRLDAQAIRDLASRSKHEPERETGREFIARVRAWLDALPRDGRVVAFTHFAVIRECIRLARRRAGPQVIDHCEIQRVELGK